MIEQTEILVVRWGATTTSGGGTCPENGQDYEELKEVDIRWDASVQAAEVVHLEATANVSGGGTFALDDFGFSEPDEPSPFLRSSSADCTPSQLTLSDLAQANDCLDRMRTLANDRSERPYVELIEALNDRDGLQVRATTDCSGSIDIDWEVEMRIWTWQRRDW